MKQFKFESYSDDTFGEYGITDDDFNSCADDTPISYKLSTPDGTGIIVTGRFSPDTDVSGCWEIGVHAIDDEKPVDWKISMNLAQKAYRNQLIVIAPDDAELICLNRCDDSD
jgi:hypothetical protein